MRDLNLPPRLAQIVPLLAAGLTNTEIADRLVVTSHTAEKYVSELKERCGARDRVDLVLRCRAELGEAAPRLPQEPAASAVPANRLRSTAGRDSHTGGRFPKRKYAFAVAAVLGACAALVVGIGVIVRPADGGFLVPAGEAERLGGGELQQAALSDGRVTQAEYSEAYQRMFDCFDDAGIPYVVSTDWRGAPQYSAGPFNSKAALDAAKQVTDGCYAEHLRGAEVARAVADR